MNQEFSIGYNVLIVDDSPTSRIKLAAAVRHLGHNVIEVDGGIAGLECMKTHPVDLVLLDIEMPEMDGFEVLETMKSDVNLRDLPVIVTSSLEGLDNVVRCIELGADDYIPKPVNKVLLDARVSSSLKKKRLIDEQKRFLQLFATVEVAQELRESGFAIGGRRISATVLFCDIRDFTALSEDMSPETAIALLNTYYTLMFEAVTGQGGIVSLMVGDGLMALFGAPHPLENSAQNAISAAEEMVRMINVLNQERVTQNEPKLKIGIGVATGEVVAGYAGTDTRATYTCIGKTVNLAARLEAHTKVVGHAILFDQKTKNNLVDETHCTAIQSVEFKGFTEALTIFGL